MNKNLIKSRNRIRDHGEVFTPDWIVNDMLDLVKQETERIYSRFLEPACGNGNFLVEILNRKLAAVKNKYKKSQLEYERNAIIAVSSIYGIDLLQDNVEEARIRLFDIFNKQYSMIYKDKCKEECRASVKFILKRNILKGDALTLKTDNNEPIVFSEWSAINGSMIKRRDFTLDNLIESKAKATGPLLEDLPETDPAFLPTPIKEYPPAHYLKLAEND